MIFINCVLFLRIHKTSPLYASCLSFVPWNVHIIDIEYPQGICLPIFVMDDFSKLFLHPSILLIKDSKSALTIDGVLSYFGYWLNSNILISLVGITTTKKSLFSHTFFMRFKFVFCSKRMKTIQTVRIPNILWRYSS